MIVCTHGDCEDYCRSRNMIPVSSYDGSIENYSGICRVLVTDRIVTDNEYFSLKSKMLFRGVELVSTRHEDTEGVSRFIFENLEKRRGKKSGGRNKFGYQNIGGEIKLTEKGRRVVKRIFELRDQGCTYSRIRDDDNVRHLDGRLLSISTIQIIIENRDFYEKEGL